MSSTAVEQLDTNPVNAFQDQLAAAGLGQANGQLDSLSATERIGWAADRFSSGLYALTSVGVDSAVMLNLIAETGLSIPVIHINSGDLEDGTLKYRDELQSLYGFELHEIGPTPDQVADITAQELRKNDLAAYSWLTKLAPLAQAVGELGITGLLTGVRSDQTDMRSTLGVIGEGNDDELRIRPIIDWPTSQVESYIEANGLPRHPKYHEGYGSVGDRHATLPGEGREGRAVMECGLHTPNRQPVIRSEVQLQLS